MTRRVRTLGGQIILRVFLVLSAVLLVLGVIQYVALSNYLQSRTAESLRAQIHSAQTSAGPRSNPAELVRALTSPRSVAAIYGPDGQPLASDPTSGLDLGGYPNASGYSGPPGADRHQGEPPDLSHRHPGSRGEMITAPDGTHWLLVSEPLDAHRNQGATVLLAGRVDDLTATLGAQAFSTIFGSSIAILAVIGLSWYLIRRALRPLHQLAGTARAIAAGDWQQRAAGGGTAEVEQVATAFNQMIGTIEEAFAQERAAADRMRRFVADAAHELRTPITALSGFVELMQGGAVQGPQQQAHALDSMARESRRLTRLINDLLRLARLDAAPALEMGPLDLSALLHALLPTLTVAAGEHPFTVDAPAPTAIRGNADALSQVIWNLVDNACKYSPPDAPVRVTCGPVADAIVLAVEDEGAGIPAVELPHVFDRFWRGDKSRSRSTGGSGLGLSIVQSLVEAHGGQVSLSARAGGGTRAEVRLPRG